MTTSLIIDSYTIPDPTPDSISGFHLGKLFTSKCEDVMFALKTTNAVKSTITHPGFVPPQGGFLKIEIPYVQILPYDDLFVSKIGIMSDAIRSYTHSIIGAKVNNDGVKTSLCGVFFNSDLCFEGFKMYYQLLGIFSTELIIFNNLNGEIKFNPIAPTRIDLNSIHNYGKRYVYPNFFELVNQNKRHVLVSEDPNGFTYDKFLNAVRLYVNLRDITLIYGSDFIYHVV